jgi:hypothetical protein
MVGQSWRFTSGKKRATVRTRCLAVEALEPRQLLSGTTQVAALLLAPTVPTGTFTANAFDLVEKAQPDEWYAGYIGGPTVPITPGSTTPPTATAIPKVNQDYLWGMTKSGDNLWLGTAANITAEAAVSADPLLRYQDGVQVIEGGASKYPGISDALRPILGDWRPPTIFRYNFQTGQYQDMVQTTALQNDPLLKQTLGLRSAGSTDDIVMLAGPNLTATGINLFAFDARSFNYLGSKSMLLYNDIRQWVTVKPPGAAQQQLYTGVLKTFSTTGQGAVLRWTGTLQKPFSFQEVVTLDGEAANLVEHAGRLFVSTWPLSGGSLAGRLGFRSAASIGIWMSPLLTSAGLTSSSAAQWQKVWSVDNYEPDPVIAKSYSGGAMASFDGYLYWGTMQLVGAGIDAFGRQYPGVPTSDVLQKTFRATAIFRGFQFDAKTNFLNTDVKKVQLLYGDNELWKYTPPPNKPTSPLGTWSKVANKTGPHRFGDSGFGNPANIYTWSMAVYGGQLYVGTYDAYTVLVAAGYPAAQGNIDVLAQAAASLGVDGVRMGGDLWCFPASNGTPSAVSLEGEGNPLNVGVRTMVSTPKGLMLGTANISNLLTAPYDPVQQPLKAGGWELIQMTPVSGQSLPSNPSQKLSGLKPAAGDLWYRIVTPYAGRLVVEATPKDGRTVQLALFDDAHNESLLAISTIVHAAGKIEQQVGVGQTYYIRVQGTSQNVDLALDNILMAGSLAASASTVQSASTASPSGTASASASATIPLRSALLAALTQLDWLAATVAATGTRSGSATEQVLAEQVDYLDLQKRLAYDNLAGYLLRLRAYA